tara:strand:- start:224 stop:355 length:132 start_codon:yes stop_codon:yes gene_type:complete
MAKGKAGRLDGFHRVIFDVFQTYEVQPNSSQGSPTFIEASGAE